MPFEISLIFAQAASAAGAQQKPSMLMTFLPFIAIFGLMYFFMIRPQKKKQKEHEELLSTIKAGDRVMLTCGMFGRVVKVTDKNVTVEVSSGVQVEFLMAAVADVIRAEAPVEIKK